MWPFTPKTLYDRYSKLIKLIMSIDSHFEITENQEDSVRLHLPNYKGNQTMDFHIYLMEPFLCINYVTEIEGEKISTVNSYPQDMNQQDIFNAVMASNLDRIHQVMVEKNEEEEINDNVIEEETVPKEENKVLRIINVWSLLEFAKVHGKMQVGDFVNKETGEEFKACIFTKPDDGTRTFVAFSTKLGELTPKQIADMKNELQVVQLESGNYSLCKIDSGWKDVDLEERLAAEAHEQRASQNDSAINALPSQSELDRKAKGILSNGEEIGIDTIFTSKDFIKGRKLKVKSLTAKFSIADIEESYMEGSQWRSKLGYYNISQDTQYHVSDIRTIEYDREKDILKLNFIQIVNNKYDSIWFSRKFDRISIEFYRHHSLMMEQKSRFDKACLPLEDLFYAFCSLSQFDGKDAIVILSGGAYQADCFQNYYNDSQVRNFKELVDVRYVYEELDEIVRGTTTDEYYIKQHGMTREEYLKENFNEVNTLTARCLKNEIDAYVHEDYSELEVGKMYKVTHIGVFRSFTRIMLDGFGDKEYNSVCFELFENGESIDRKYTREHRFWAPYLRKLKKIE